MGKLTKYTVAVIPKRSIDSDDFLIVRRPAEDKDLADSWGLAAVTLQPGELPEEGAIRACREKLGCEVTPTRFLGIMFQKRNSYDIFLMDIEVVLKPDEIADISKAQTAGTAYAGQLWTSDPNMLMDSAKAGSCCASIFLTDRGILDKVDWVASLEGSDTVS